MHSGKKTILVVDDNPINRDLIAAASAGSACQCEQAENGREALAKVKARNFSLIFMDLLMPGMDGISATMAIRREVPDTEVVALTSVLEDASVVDAVRAGAIGYLLKDTEAHE
ncbi:MAG: response regulator, partial [Proteobacteria bacterium]|nr:response regulator [Pseudomonadota bacterium]